jgi:Rho-binding antiterminator
VKKTEDEVPGTSYLPISCDIYSELEVAILHRNRLHLTWHDGNVCYTQAVLPLDLETDAGEEFLHCLLASGERMRVRLDRITRMEPA